MFFSSVLTLLNGRLLVKSMKLNDKQIRTISQLVFESLKKETQSPVTMKVEDKVVLEKIQSVIQGNIRDEQDLDREVDKMLDDLERSHGGEFQRYKMFGMVKKKLAEQKGFVL